MATAPVLPEVAPHKTNKDAALRSMYDSISSREHVSVLGDLERCRAMTRCSQLMATTQAVPLLWSYAETSSRCCGAPRNLITMDDSERRSLILVNPGLAPKRASVTTMYTAYRLNDPERDHAAAQALAERDPLRPDRQGQLHRRRGRGRGLRSRRHGADAERRLAQPRHRRRRAGGEPVGARPAAGRDAAAPSTSITITPRSRTA